MRKSVRSVLLLSLLLASVAVKGSGQTIQGTLRDRASNRVLDDIEVTLTNTATGKQVETKSDSIGEFVFRSLKPGGFVLSIGRAGRSYAHELSLVVKERLQLYIHVPTDTSALHVAATSSRVHKLEAAGFYERYAKGRGQFIMREDIERTNPRSLADVLANVRGVRVEWGTRGGDAIIRSGGGGAGALSGGGICRPSIYLDGVLIRAGGNQEPDILLEQVERPDRVEAIEVYAGAAQLPVSFSGAQSTCGAIIIWTR
jgi:hypothetical protein